jgi:hypothetical protein
MQDNNKSEVLIYTSLGNNTIQVELRNDNIWLSQAQIADLFAVSADNISLHLKNIYQEKELEERATTEESSVVRKE